MLLKTWLYIFSSDLYAIVDKLASPATSFVYIGADIDELVNIYGQKLPVLNKLFNTTAEEVIFSC